MSNSSFEELLASRQAAELLKVHPKTLQRLVSVEDIPVIRIGKLYRFRASDLDAWIRSKVNSEAPSVPRLKKKG